MERSFEYARNQRWADEAWCSFLACNTGAAFSADFERGFKNGFVEHLERGGDGEPPLVAPLHYRHLRYQNPEGYAAIQNWFAGYRRGASQAEASGVRRWITGPSALEGSPPSEETPLVTVSRSDPKNSGRKAIAESYRPDTEPITPVVEPTNDLVITPDTKAPEEPQGRILAIIANSTVDLPMLPAIAVPTPPPLRVSPDSNSVVNSTAPHGVQFGPPR
jgi:hypothetical protein